MELTATMDIESLKEKIIEETTQYESDALVRITLSGKPNVQSTKDYYTSEKLDFKGGVILGINPVPKIFYSVLFALMISFFADEYYLQVHNYTIPFLITWFVGSVIVFFTTKNIRFFYPEIRIDTNGITLLNNHIGWEHIADTFILYIGFTGGYNKPFLIIVDIFEVISKYDLHYIEPEEIAPIIEYYKEKNKQQTQTAGS